MFTWVCPLCNEYHSKQIEKSTRTVGWYVRNVCRCFRCDRTGIYYFVIYNPVLCISCSNMCGELKVIAEEIIYNAT